MYAKYHTNAIVLGSTAQGEADKRIVLFTREFGLIRARATALRREDSRMRYALQHFSCARVSLVRGETGWRAVGALAQHSYTNISRGALSSFARIAQLVVRLVGEEEKNERLFILLESAQLAFASSDPEAISRIELLCVARILHTLGYLSESAVGVIYTDALFAPQALEIVSQNRDTLLSSVNRALSETHL